MSRLYYSSALLNLKSIAQITEMIGGIHATTRLPQIAKKYFLSAKITEMIGGIHATTRLPQIAKKLISKSCNGIQATNAHCFVQLGKARKIRGLQISDVKCKKKK